MVGQFKKAYLPRPIKILHFLTPARIQKRITSKYFSLFNNKPPAGWVTHITSDLHAIPVRIIVPCSNQAIFLHDQKVKTKI